VRATQELRNEHEGIKLLLRILKSVADRVLAGEAVPREDLDSIGEFLSVFADRCHHGKEEDHLFPALAEAGVPRDGGPIAVMLGEHTRGRSLIADLKDGIAGLQAKLDGAPAKFAAASLAYVDLLTQHTEKENQVLFRIADQRLSAADDERLVQAFAKLEHERIGPGKHEEFHALLDRLRAQYLE